MHSRGYGHVLLCFPRNSFDRVFHFEFREPTRGDSILEHIPDRLGLRRRSCFRYHHLRTDERWTLQPSNHDYFGALAGVSMEKSAILYFQSDIRRFCGRLSHNGHVLARNPSCQRVVPGSWKASCCQWRTSVYSVLFPESESN